MDFHYQSCSRVYPIVARGKSNRPQNWLKPKYRTTRTVYRIIRDLEQEGYIKKIKAGRENRYTVNQRLPLRRKNQRDIQIRELLQAISNSID